MQTLKFRLVTMKLGLSIRIYTVCFGPTLRTDKKRLLLADCLLLEEFMQSSYLPPCWLEPRVQRSRRLRPPQSWRRWTSRGSFWSTGLSSRLATAFWKIFKAFFKYFTEVYFSIVKSTRWVLFKEGWNSRHAWTLFLEWPVSIFLFTNNLKKNEKLFKNLK